MTERRVQKVRRRGNADQALAYLPWRARQARKRIREGEQSPWSGAWEVLRLVLLGRQRHLVLLEGQRRDEGGSHQESTALGTSRGLNVKSDGRRCLS